MNPASRSGAALLWLGLPVLVYLVVSGVQPYDRMTWLLEVFPVLLALPILLATYRRFPLTSLLYGLIALHALVLIGGGAYTYARVPLGDWLQAVFELSRNPYDKIGHLMQGIVPALLTREILWRCRYVTSRSMNGFLSVCVALAVSAVYEMIEWATALLFGSGAYDFLGTQGDIWDTQSDMFFALVGALSALVVLGRLHDRQMASIGRSPGGVR